MGEFSKYIEFTQEERSEFILLLIQSLEALENPDEVDPTQLNSKSD